MFLEPNGLTQERIFQYNQKLKFETKFWYRLAVIAVIMVIIGFCMAYVSTPTESNAISEDTLKFTVMKLRKQFPSLQQQLLKKIKAAFLRLKTHDEPFVFLLLHDDKNKKTTDCLASYASSVAKQNIFTNTSKSLWMNASEWVQYSDPDDLDLFYEKVTNILLRPKTSFYNLWGGGCPTFFNLQARFEIYIYAASRMYWFILIKYIIDVLYYTLLSLITNQFISIKYSKI